MITLACFKNDDILQYIGIGMPKVLLNTEKYGQLYVRANSTRLECLKRNQECVRCGILGTTWYLETHMQKVPRVNMNCFIDNCPWCGLTRKIKPRKMHAPHLNLYAVTKGGNKILMTQDHIFPKHAGGSNEIENLQTMCQCCNSYKGGMLPGEYEEVLSARERTRYIRSMDGRSAPTRRFTQVYSFANEYENNSISAAE